jgi:cytochrome c oxidase cbb3-type subunit 2
MPGSLRAGPDLANVGIRQPDPHWHLRHLYAPKSQVSDSSMPSYRYLFEKRKVARAPSPDALALPGKWAAPDGFEIVPKPEAQALAAYLVSLRADAPLFVAPFTPAAPAAVVSTNSPADTAATATNAPPK